MKIDLTQEEYKQLEAIKVLYPWAKWVERDITGDIRVYEIHPNINTAKYLKFSNDLLLSVVCAAKPLNIDEALEGRGCDKWIDLKCMDERYGNVYQCSACGNDNIGKSNYCPNCGKRLEESE